MADHQISELHNIAKNFDLSAGSVHRSKVLSQIEGLINKHTWKGLTLSSLAWLGVVCIRANIWSRDFWLLKGTAVQDLLPQSTSIYAANYPTLLVNYSIGFPYMQPSFFTSLRADFLQFNSEISTQDNIKGLRALQVLGYSSTETNAAVLNSVLGSRVTVRDVPSLVNAYKDTFDGDRRDQFKAFIEQQLATHYDDLTPVAISYFVKGLAHANFNPALVARLARKVASEMGGLNQYQLVDCIKSFGTYDRGLCKPFITEKNGRPLKRSALLAD
jgi:hypothetical protein